MMRDMNIDIQVPITVACRLKEFREQRGYTQKDVSNITGITEVSISRYENMKRLPDAVTIFKLAQCYNVSVAELYPN